MKKMSMLEFSKQELEKDEKRMVTGGARVAPCLSASCECDNGDNSNWKNNSAETQKNAG